MLLANLVFKPIAVKLERRTEQRLVLMNMVLEGISMMCVGRSPSLMRETLKAFVAQYDDEIDDRRRPARPATPLSHGRRFTDRPFPCTAAPRVDRGRAATGAGTSIPAWRWKKRAGLITYLDVITLILVLMVVLLAFAGPGKGKDGQQAKADSAPTQASGPVPGAPYPSGSIVPPAVPPTSPEPPAAPAAPPLPKTLNGLPLDQLGADVEIIMTDDAVRFRISSEILFESGAAHLAAEGQPVLDRLIPLLNSDPNLRLVVEGHTDSVPIQTERFPSNWELSTGRAAAVARYLIEPGRGTAACASQRLRRHAPAGLARQPGRPGAQPARGADDGTDTAFLRPGTLKPSRFDKILTIRGDVAQLGERRVRNAKVGSSILLVSTTPSPRSAHGRCPASHPPAPQTFCGLRLAATWCHAFRKNTPRQSVKTRRLIK